MDEKLESFKLFTHERRAELQRIAYSTNGEQELSDIISQAWVMSEDMITTGSAEMRGTQFQDRLLQELRNYFHDSSSYQRRYRTIRLDVNEYDDDTLEPHPLMRVLTSSSPDPLEQIIDEEEPGDEAKPGEIEMEYVHSLAGAYGKLLCFFDRNIRKLAAHLLISVAQARRRCDYVRLLAANQRPLPYALPSDFMPARGIHASRKHALRS